MAKKKILVKDVLGLIEPKAKVSISFYAYGVPTGMVSTQFSIETPEDCMKKLNLDALSALVFRIDTQECTGNQINLYAELVH